MQYLQENWEDLANAIILSAVEDYTDERLPARLRLPGRELLQPGAHRGDQGKGAAPGQ